MAMATPKRAISVKRLAVLAAGLLSLVSLSAPAAAQGWWPWNNQQQQPPPQQRPAPVPRDPVFRPQGQPGVPAPIPQQPGQRANVCVQLETRLVDAQRGAATDQLPRIEAEFRLVERTHQQSQSQLERSDCYDYWLFSKTLRRTKQCIDLAGQAESSKRKLAELDAQRQQIRGSSTQSITNDLYRELARNRCGVNYERYVKERGLDSQNPFSSLWQDEDTGPPGRWSTYGAPPGVTTYRTVCVRLCDGYFFPISFSTLESHFERDVDACQSRCAAPAELYYYQNPGGSIEQAISARNRAPYNGLKTALRFRKEYVQGCSCKQAEYTPAPADRPLERKTEAPAATPVPARGTAQQVQQLPR